MYDGKYIPWFSFYLTKFHWACSNDVKKTGPAIRRKLLVALAPLDPLNWLTADGAGCILSIPVAGGLQQVPRFQNRVA